MMVSKTSSLKSPSGSFSSAIFSTLIPSGRDSGVGTSINGFGPVSTFDFDLGLRRISEGCRSGISVFQLVSLILLGVLGCFTDVLYPPWPGVSGTSSTIAIMCRGRASALMYGDLVN
jgi:hypothetical protein